jgi:hypothetical protein
VSKSPGIGKRLGHDFALCFSHTDRRCGYALLASLRSARYGRGLGTVAGPNEQLTAKDGEITQSVTALQATEQERGDKVSALPALKTAHVPPPPSPPTTSAAFERAVISLATISGTSPAQIQCAERAFSRGQIREARGG